MFGLSTAVRVDLATKPADRARASMASPARHRAA